MLGETLPRAYQVSKIAKENLVTKGKLPPKGVMHPFPELPQKNP